jgi:hypothetical protein
MAPSPSGQIASRQSSAVAFLRNALPFLAAFLLMLTFLTFPPPSEPDEERAYRADPSLTAVLGYAQEHGLQFGKDIAYTYGPLGFLVMDYYYPRAAGLRMVVEVALCFAVAMGICLIAWRLKWWWRCLLLAGFAWGASNIYPADIHPRADLFMNVGFLCWGLLCFVESGRRLAWSVAVFTALATFCALCKLSYLFVTAGSVPLLAGALLVRGNRRLALGITAGTAGGFLLGWILAGQGLAHLGPFLANAIAMVQAYNAALGFEPVQMARNRGLLLAVLLFALLLLRTRTAFGGSDKRTLARRGLLLAWLLLLTFTVWKHGFVRAYDGYLSMCFIYMAVLAVALEMFAGERQRLRRWDSLLTGACWVIPLITAQFLSFPTFPASAAMIFHSFGSNLRGLLQPGDYLRRADEAFEENRRGAQLPQCRKIIGSSSVDVFGYRQAFAILNDLNFCPRPDFQSYGACNAHMMRLNERFFLSKAAPEYVLFELTPLDRKWPPLEDGYVLRDLLINYQPVATEKNFILFKAKSAEAPKQTLVSEGAVHPGEPIDLSGYGDANLWLEIELEPSFLGRIRQFLSRPAPVRLAAWREPHKGLILRKRAPASMLSAGLLASPLLPRNEDVLEFYGTNSATRPRAYSVELLPGDKQLWRASIRFRIYRIENPLGHRASVTVPGPVKTRDQALFPSATWRPGQEPPGGLDEELAFALFALLPCASGIGLVAFARHMKRRRRAATWGWVLAGNALVLLTLVSVSFVAAETYFRFFYDTTDSLAYTKVCARWVQRHWQVNRAGCRDNVEYSPVLQPGKHRVTFIGDSFTAGHGIKNVEDRFPNLVRRAHPEWEIQVLAMVGLDTGMEQVWLNRAFIKGYQVDQVVLVYCLNDIGDLMPEQSEAMVQILAHQGGWLPENSYFVNLLYHRYKAAHLPLVKDYFGYVREAYRGPLWEQQQKRLKAFRDSVQAHGGRLAVVTFPFLHALGPHYECQFIHDQLDQFWRELHVPHLDLLPVYKDLPPSRLTVNPYDAHPNELANKLAADAINKFLSDPPLGWSNRETMADRRAN